MSSDISIDGQFIWVSNARLARLVDFGLAVGREAATTASELKWVDKLADWQDNQAWPGISFELAELFPTLDERKFWATCYANVARRIFLRELGRHDVTHWQASTIGYAYLISRLLTRSVQHAELGWHPHTEDGDDYTKSLNVCF